MRILRLITILAVVALCVSFSIQLGLMVNERLNWAKPPTGFAVDSAPQYTVGLFHIMSFFLLGALVVARKYYWSVGLAIVYLSLNVYGTYARLGTGFLGGDMCPEGHPCLRAIRRASWFDWTATILLLIVAPLISSMLIHQLKREVRK